MVDSKTTLGAGMSDDERRRIDRECNPRTLPGISDNQTASSLPTVEDADRPLFTLEELETWRARKADLDKLLGDAGREAAWLGRKIKAAEFLLGESENHGR